jgi:hypothetical protein
MQVETNIVRKKVHNKLPTKAEQDHGQLAKIAQ